MKRLKTDDSSSNSGDESISLSRIKSQYKKQKTSASNETSSKNKKKEDKSKVDSKQPTLDKLFQKSNPKRKTMDEFFPKVDPKKPKSEVSSTSFFGGAKSAKPLKTEETNKMGNDDSISDDVLKDINFDEVTEASTSYRIPKKKNNQTPEVISIKSPSKIVSPDVSIPKTKSPAKIKNSPDKLKTPDKNNNSESNKNTPKSANKAAYFQYMNRSKPTALGTKEIPEGSPTCLQGMTFVVTGVLQYIERDDAHALIEKHGGRVTKAVSGKTTYLVKGEEPGESKINKALQNGKTKIISEDDLFDLIQNSKKEDKSTDNTTNNQTKSSAVPLSGNPTKSVKSSTLPAKSVFANIASDKTISNQVKTNAMNCKSNDNLSGKPIITTSKSNGSQEKVSQSKSVNNKQYNELLVDKYRPKSIKQIVGQHGDRSPAKKLMMWLQNWDKFYKNGFQKTAEEGSNFRAALLSGPPGIGKTTTAHLVAKELGYDVVEKNASSTRSKSELSAILPSILSCHSIRSLDTNKNRICLIMDEVDGMAGNADRGGVAQLIQVLKKAQTPLICVCNDRQSQKIRSLVNYVYDLPFRKLTQLQVKATLKSILEREELQLPENSLDQIVLSTNCDLRQVLNQVQLWTACSGGRDISTDQINSDISGAHKDFKLKIFDICARIFSHEGCKTFTDKMDLFFQDYQFSGLFVQENYLSVRPYKAKGDNKKTLKLMSLAADSISDSDIVSSKVRANNDWALLPVQGSLASVLPGEYMHGRVSAMIKFPRWLGSYSSQNKNIRSSNALASHLRLSTGAVNGKSLVLEYGSVIMRQFGDCMREGDVEGCVNLLGKWQLMREDIELLSSLLIGVDSKEVSSKVKAAITRQYKSAGFKLPYTTEDVKKSAGKMANLLKETDEFDEEEGEVKEDKDTNEDNLDADAMIVKKKVDIKKKPAADTGTKAKPTKTKKTMSKETGGSTSKKKKA